MLIANSCYQFKDHEWSAAIDNGAGDDERAAHGFSTYRLLNQVSFLTLFEEKQRLLSCSLRTLLRWARPQLTIPVFVNLRLNRIALTVTVLATACQFAAPFPSDL